MSERLGFVCLCGSVVVAVVAVDAHGQVSFTDISDDSQISALHQPQDETIPAAGEWMTGGMAAGDFNADGLIDLFVVSGGGGPDHLYINNGDGTFDDEALAWGLNQVHCGNGAAVADYDGDGDLDIYVTSFGFAGGEPQVGANRLYRNNGSSFSEVAFAAGVNVASDIIASGYGGAWGDYDLDGDLDLAVASWGHQTDGNRVYRNDGDGTFTDVTTTTIGSDAISVWGFQPAFADINGDLFPELLISADFESSRYYANNGDGTFANMTASSGTGLDDNGMGQTVADLDRDGKLDWYVTSIHKDNPQPDDMIGNMQYRSVGNHLFDEVSGVSGTNDGGWGWGAVAFDVDHDGHIDIVETNGREAAGGEWLAESSKLFHNNGDGTFSEIAAASGLEHYDSGRAIVKFDLENDGDLDVAIFTNAGPVNVYRNDSTTGNWLLLEFDTSTHPHLAPGGFGTRVEATVMGETLVRYVDGSPSYLATIAPIAHLGLGDAKVIDSLTITWSRGYTTTMTDVQVNQRLTITAPMPGDFNGDGAVAVEDLVTLILAWGEVTDAAGVTADMNLDGQVDVQDLVAVITAWG
ncbi:MAG: FG-GAP-like repeat-containing protein [Planctomycetota bacterium]